MIRATEHPVSRVTNRDQIAWAANKPMNLTVAFGARRLSAGVRRTKRAVDCV